MVRDIKAFRTDPRICQILREVSTGDLEEMEKVGDGKEMNINHY